MKVNLAGTYISHKFSLFESVPGNLAWEPCLGTLLGTSSWEPCLRTCSWEPLPGNLAWEPLPGAWGNLLGTSWKPLGNLLGTLLGNLLGTSWEPCLGTCCWEPCLGTCSWEPGNPCLGFSWERRPLPGNLVPNLARCGFGCSDLLRGLYYG